MSRSKSGTETIQENILKEASRMAGKSKSEEYGHPYDDFKRVAAMWTEILDPLGVLRERGLKITPEHVALCQIAVKISREAHRHKRDNLVDMCGYARTIEVIKDTRRDWEE